MAPSDRQSIEKAIEELAHHDPASRFRARQFLIEHAEPALPLIQEALKRSEKLAVDYYQELVRVRDWITYGEDPERLNELIQALDLQHLSHGNMFGGMAGAIETAPQFKEFIGLGKRVWPFLQAVLENNENSYALRAAAATILKKTGTVHSVPILIAALEAEHQGLRATGQAALKLEERYRGFFIAATHETLMRLTGEFFLRGLFQTFFTGFPEAIYDVHLSTITIQRWRDWWEKLGPQIESGNDPADAPADNNFVKNLLEKLTESPDDKAHARYAINRFGARGDPTVVDFVLTRPPTDSAAASLIEMLIQNGRGSSLPEGKHTGELIAVWLATLHDTSFLRDAVVRGYAQLPASTLRAISTALPNHILAREYPDLFNPYAVTQMDTPTLRQDYSDSATEEIIHGLHSEDTATRHLFFEIAQGAAAKVSSQEQGDNPPAPASLTTRLLEIRDRFTAYDDRVAIMKVLRSVRIEPELAEVLEALRNAQPDSSTESLADLIDMIPGKEVPEDLRPSVMQQLFALLKTRPSLSTEILRILDDLAPEFFPFFPAIGERGVSALVRIYELTNGHTGAPDKDKLTSALQEFRADVHEHVVRSQFLQQFLGVKALGIASKVARQFELPGELHDSLIHRASILGQIPPISSSDLEAFKNDLDESLTNCDYLKCLQDEREPTTYDLAGCLFEGAGRVAAENHLGRDKVLTAKLAVADVAGKAKRYDYAEEIYLGMDLSETDDPQFVVFQKHFYSELLVHQGRWADARDVALELRQLYSQQKPATQEQWHFFNDTLLHEFFCSCRFENFGYAMTLIKPLTANYEKLKIFVHFVEVLIEAASMYGKLGAHEVAEQQFKNIQEMFDDDPMAGPTRLTALSREASYLMSIGKTERAVDLLDQARLLWETLPPLENRHYEKIAEVFWLLGQAHLMNGDAPRAHQALTQLRAWADSQLAEMYRGRLQAKIEASFGSIAAAITTLQEIADLPGTKAYPDLRVEVCLDLCELLIAEGFHDRCLEVLRHGYEIAAEARNPHLMASIKIMEGHVLENTANAEQAGAIYRELIASDQANEIPDLVAVASLNILSLLAAKEGNINLANDVEGLKKSLTAIQNVRWRISSLQRFARLYLSNNRPDDADFMLDALDEEIKAGTPLNVVLECKMLRGQSARLKGRVDETVGHFREAVNILEVVHSSVLERGLGAGFFVSKDSPYRALVQALVEAGKHSEALHYVERAKTRLFLDQIHWRVINNYDETNPLVRYLQILKRLAFLELDTEKTDVKVRREERAALENELETLRAGIPEKDLIAAVYPVLGGPADMQRDLKSVLSTGKVISTTRMILAEYFMTDEALLLFVMRDDFSEPEVLTIDRKPAEVHEFVFHNLHAETDADGRVLKSTGEKLRKLDEAAFQELFAPLVAPLLGESGDGTLRTNGGDLIWFVPYDVLHYVPLHAVKVDGQYLIERNPVVYSPSASIMKYCQLQGSTESNSALVVGDSLNDLPHALEEALTVSSLFGTDPLLGSQATKSAVTDLIQQARQSVDVLHFSCHGYFDNVEALKSGIMLAPDSNLPADQGQWNLTAEEIFNIELHAGLVTLSACETGVSEQRHGDELIGLTRALIHAGIPALIVTLWTVNDTSTALLMHEFYSKLRDGGLISKAAALQAAQKYVLNLTAKDCIEYFERRLEKLTRPEDFSRAIRHRLDRANFHVLAGDLQSALVAYKQIRQELMQTSDEWAVQIREQIDRGLLPIEIKAEEDPPKIDFTVRVYQRIYHWAPFVLVGDWR